MRSMCGRRGVIGALALVAIGPVACGGSNGGDVADAGTALDATEAGDSAVEPDAASGPDARARDDAGRIDAGGGLPSGLVPRAVRVARTTSIPACTVFVDAAYDGASDGTATRPHSRIGAAVEAASDGAVICVAEGTYAESIAPGDKAFTLAGGFQSNQMFTVRDSSRYVSRAQGDGSGSFVRIEDPGPGEGRLTAIDGFEITGYSQAIYRDIYYSQRFDITNNFIHDNACAEDGLNGSGFSVSNVSGTIANNVIARNTCWRGGAGAANDSTNSNSLSIIGNWVDSNAGTEPGISHGGGLYLFANELVITGNELTGNTVTGWGGGLYVGAFTGGGQQTTAYMFWNVYRANRAGGAGGGFFCDDSALCISDHEIYQANCGGNIYLDSGPDGSGATVATFDHLTNDSALAVGCDSPGPGVSITKTGTAVESYSFTNSIFWGHGMALDFATACESGCDRVTVTVDWSIVQTSYANDGIDIVFGEGNLPSVDPQFVDAAAGDFHLRSTRGHWTPEGPVMDATDSPALAAGDPSGSVADNPERAGNRTEMGAYGNSPEASYVR